MKQDVQNAGVEISQANGPMVDQVWPHIESLVNKALKHGQGDRMTAKEIRDSIREGRRILWLAHEGQNIIGAIVLEVIQCVKHKTLFITMIAGSRFHAWAPKAFELGRELCGIMGIERMEASTRFGLEKWMKPMGFRRKAVILEYQL